MGVELRNFQRKFQTLMGEVKPRIKPRIVVWLDERLAEFKIKGSMQLVETLEDPKWIKDYYTSKRESKAAAIKGRGNKITDSTVSIQPKVEEKSESSNGVAHPEELSVSDKKEEQEECDDYAASEQVEESADDSKNVQSIIVKKEQNVEEEDDDDMIIVGESIAPPHPSRMFNPNRQMFRGGLAPFHRKRQRFSSSPHRTLKSVRLKPNFNQFPPSHTVTSQSVISSPPSQSFTMESQSFGSNPQSYDTQTFPTQQSFRSELIRLPSQSQVDYHLTESDIYTDYGDDSYDSSFLTEGESSIVYDEEGNAMLKGENVGDDSSMDPVPGTSSDPASSQDLLKGGRNQQARPTVINSFRCHRCNKTYQSRGNLTRHIRCNHLNISNYSCGYCHRAFPNENNLDGHVNSQHLKIRPHSCDNCGKDFMYKAELYGHKKHCSVHLND